MLQEDILAKKALADTYDSFITVYGFRQVKTGDITYEEEYLLYENIPCGISIKAKYPLEAKDISSGVYNIKIFCDNIYKIPPGSKIVIYSNSMELECRNASEAMVYPTHEELIVRRIL